MTNSDEELRFNSQTSGALYHSSTMLHRHPPCFKNSMSIEATSRCEVQVYYHETSQMLYRNYLIGGYTINSNPSRRSIEIMINTGISLTPI